MTFGRMVRRLREKAGMTQADLAEKSGIPLRTIQGWEQDYRCPISLDFFKLAKALGVDCTAFADCEDVAAEPEPKKPSRRKRKGE
jgi:transcriptional regulator with XRE-family HTH domain